MARVAYRLPFAASVRGILVGLALLLFVHGPATAAGKLDSSYGAQGMYRTVDRWVPLVLPHPDGRSVFVVSTRSDNCCTNSDAYVRLLDAEGRPSADYGDAGSAQFQMRAVWAGVVLPDGGVIVGGSSDEGGGFLASLSPMGAPGRFFAGKSQLGTGHVTAIARDHEGGILFAEDGPFVGDSCVRDGWRIRRLNAAGELDTGWGDRGTVTSLAVEGSTSFSCEVSELWVTPTGERMVATTGKEVVRLQANGQVDPGFKPIAVKSLPLQVMSLADGRLLLATPALPAAQATTIRRYDDRGFLDRSFGNGTGEVTIDLAPAATGSSSAQAASSSSLVVGDDGRHIYLTVWANQSAADGEGGVGLGEIVARLTQDGRLDATFGSGGIVRLTRAFQLGVHGLFPNSDGSLLVATYSGVLKLTGGDEPSRGLIDAYFSPNPVMAGERLQLVVSRLAGSDGEVTVSVGYDDWTSQPGVHFVPFGQSLTWATAKEGTRWSRSRRWRMPPPVG